MVKHKITVLEDDQVLLDVISELMIQNGYQVNPLPCISKFKAYLENEPMNASLFLIDLSLPDGHGLEVCRALRNSSDVPIAIITVQNDEESILKGFEAGADDYITKPFSIRILMARVKALLLRKDGFLRTVIRTGDLNIDIENNTVTANGIKLELLAKEFQIIYYIVSAKGCLVKRDTLFSKVWEIDSVFVNDNTLSVHVSRIRKKLGRFRGKSYIETERGMGYRWGVEIE